MAFLVSDLQKNQPEVCQSMWKQLPVATFSGQIHPTPTLFRPCPRATNSWPETRQGQQPASWRPRYWDLFFPYYMLQYISKTFKNMYWTGKLKHVSWMSSGKKTKMGGLSVQVSIQRQDARIPLPMPWWTSGPITLHNCEPCDHNSFVRPRGSRPITDPLRGWKTLHRGQRIEMRYIPGTLDCMKVISG